MSKYVYIVTNPELGWDSVVAVFDSTVSEDDIAKEFNPDIYVLHRRVVETVVEPQ